MFPAKVIGHVVCTVKEESLKGIKLLILQPLTWDGKLEKDYIIAADSVSAGYNEFVFYVQAREAAVVFPTVPPVDASVVGIIDEINLKG